VGPVIDPIELLALEPPPQPNRLSRIVIEANQLRRRVIPSSPSGSSHGAGIGSDGPCKTL
jgi:hypothetical protein